jgi:DNA-binding response OmpR family regulator
MAGSHRKEAGVAPTNRGFATVQQAVTATRDELSQPEKVVTVLAISPAEEDHQFLANIFSHSKWQLRNASSWREGLAALGRQRVPVLICESELPDATWKEVLAELAGLPERPLLIVSSRLADESFWAEVLNLGAYDVLMKPFDATEVFRVVSLAWLNWKNARELDLRRHAAGPGPEFLQAVGM